MNYVRKLGFEETPDYDFLRELFTKVIRNNGDIEDDIFDWNLLHDGKGWEASVSQHQPQMPPARVPQDAGYGDRRKERDERRRSQVQGSNVVPPSPALVRHGSKQRKIPAVLTPGPLAAQPPQAHIHNRANNGQHPYAVGGYEYARDPYSQNYGLVSPMVSAPAVSNVHVRAMGEAGVSQEYNGQDLGDEPNKPSFLRILTCRC